jgi:predicted lysophospholipase L1 biosynthesis ABC-type transport system permease subunit
MNGQTITFASGFILLLVFALVGWNLRRKRAREEPTGAPDVASDEPKND